MILENELVGHVYQLQWYVPCMVLACGVGISKGLTVQYIPYCTASGAIYMFRTDAQPASRCATGYLVVQPSIFLLVPFFWYDC